MNRIPVIIDTDPGYDDAIALVLAMSSEALDIRGITVTFGNDTLDNTTNNVLRIVGYFGCDIGVYKGAGQPILGFEPDVGKSHGHSGLKSPGLPKKASGRAQNRSAVEFMEDELRNTSERIKILAIGPLTNIALLLSTAPELRERIDEIIIMGGAALGGNRTPAAEFNIWLDPEAAHIVFSSGIRLTMCGLDVTEKATLLREDVERIRAQGGKAGIFTADLLDFSPGWNGSDIAVHDAVAVSKILKPELFRSEMLNVVIDLDGHYTRGCTVTDLNRVTGNPPNAEVVLDLDRRGFVEFLIGSLKNLNRKTEGGSL